MNERIHKAMLLAAGLGTRLRPLTLETPKPLIEIDGVCLIDHQLRYLAQSGIVEVMINLHHLGDRIRAHVGDGSRFGARVSYSEEPQILGTGGGIKKAQEFFGRDSFVALNADALIDADLSGAIAAHVRGGAAATMVLKELSEHDRYNPVEVDADGFVRSFGAGRHFYTGLQIIGPGLLDALPAAGAPSCLIREGYEVAIAGGMPIRSFIHTGYFNDLGTHARLEAARQDVASGKFNLIRS